MHSNDDELPIGGPVDDGSDDLLIRRAARELQAPVRFGAGFDERVMAAVRAAAADDAVEHRLDPRPAAPGPKRSAAGRAWAWVVRPRTLKVSPLAGLAIAAGLAAVMVVTGRGTPAGPTPDVGAPPNPGLIAYEKPTTSQVQFVLVAPDAKTVSLVGDFNDWNAAAAPLTPTRTGGVWTISVPLQPGRYTYNFVVDGTTVLADPAAPPAPADDFGTPASVVTVAGSQT